jgi:hypothetical protein
VLHYGSLEHAEAVQCIQHMYSGCRDHEGFSGGHEGACRVAILTMQRLYNVYSTCIGAVETMRVLVGVMRVLVVWQS